MELTATMPALLSFIMLILTVLTIAHMRRRKGLRAKGAALALSATVALGLSLVMLFGPRALPDCRLQVALLFAWPVFLVSPLLAAPTDYIGTLGMLLHRPDWDKIMSDPSPRTRLRRLVACASLGVPVLMWAAAAIYYVVSWIRDL